MKTVLIIILLLLILIFVGIILLSVPSKENYTNLAKYKTDPIKSITSPSIPDRIKQYSAEEGMMNGSNSNYKEYEGYILNLPQAERALALYYKKNLPYDLNGLKRYTGPEPGPFEQPIQELRPNEIYPSSLKRGCNYL